MLIGDHEVIYRPKLAWERAARLIPDLRGEIIPGAGHLLNIEQAEITNRRMLESLSSIR